jgi:hypothetical protein
MSRVRVLAIPVLVLSVLAWSVGVQAQPVKKATGTVTAVAADSLTVKVRDKDMTFTVDSKTVVEAKGAGTKAKAAQAKGAAGAKLGDVVKAGDAVEVSYHDLGATLHATMVRAVASAGGGSLSEDKPASHSASGTVKSVVADSLVVTGGGKDWTFTVAAKTAVIGTGVGTKTKAMGGKAAITDLVAIGDKVTVSYMESGGSMMASRVTITSKASK